VPEKVLDRGTIPFQVEGRLLQELGERLVASPEVALVELIKNAYDADSPLCEVRLENRGKLLVIADEGHGITFKDFSNRWMRIATPNKIKERQSPIYRRPLTGAKGIGRFAVRFLGDELKLVTAAYDQQRACKTRLTAEFDWPKIDRWNDISKTEVNYTLERVDADIPTGTTLEISRLKAIADFSPKSSLRTDVLRIVTPLQGLDPGRFKRSRDDSKKDPGFRVLLPAGENKSSEVDIAELVLNNYWARLCIDLSGTNLTFKVFFSSSRMPKILRLKVSTTISAGFVADIRYFPRRKGVFKQKGIKGQAAWKWVRDNHGIAVVDHGFRIVPYGYRFDDWLHLDSDKAHSERDWRSGIAQKHFPIPEALRNRPADNPALYLPYNFQLVGAVFVESKPIFHAKLAEDLIPSMDREGYIKTEAFDDLVEFVRAGIEFLALEDKRDLDRILTREAQAATKQAREDVRGAIKYIQRSPTLTRTDKARLTKVYARLADQIDEVEEYHEQSRRSLITMSLLGVVAGFMTHESKSIVFEMDKAIDVVTSLVRKYPDLKDTAVNLKNRLSTFKGQLEYAQMFLNGVRRDEAVRMSAAGQIRHVLKRFESFAIDHDITVNSEVPAKAETPALPPAVYSGVLLNLYTNAIKAVLAGSSSIREPKVQIRAWNESRNHYLEVSDNGVGIPPGLRKRVWDPLYTTTSDTGNPLGSGMGLGLTLVKQVVEDVGGKIHLIEDAPDGFNTCFRVVFPME